jgi:TrkA family protein
VGAALSVVAIISISLVIIRVATSALVMTGMARESARFQARSAFLGVGFTTAEAESIVAHPVRRRIAMWLMWLGNAGVVTVLGGLILSFGGERSALGSLGTIVAGIVLLWLLTRSRLVEKPLERLIQRLLHRFGGLDVRDYAGLLHVKGGWTIDELKVEASDWIAGRPLGTLGLRDEGILVLGIDRDDGEYVGTPHGDDEVRGGDTLVLYGRRQRIAELDDRHRGTEGERAHAAAVAEQERLEAA